MENKHIENTSRPVKTALVTGGSKGIGKAIADRLAADGYQVLILARTPVENCPHRFYQADISSTEDLEKIIAAIYEELGAIDLLVNNAGITKDNLMLRMSLEDFHQVLNVNLVSAFYLSKLVSKHMLKRRQGKIINISSVVGLHGNAGQANYAASKAGLIGLTQSMAKEFASRGIQVNAIAPGFIETAMTDILPEEYKADLKKQIPLQRFGQPEDIAGAVSFLASEQANYITGQVLSVCGGMSI